jgi:hypothetical protein
VPASKRILPRIGLCYDGTLACDCIQYNTYLCYTRSVVWYYDSAFSKIQRINESSLDDINSTVKKGIAPHLEVY